jgi:hypothetical protein
VLLVPSRIALQVIDVFNRENLGGPMSDLVALPFPLPEEPARLMAVCVALLPSCHRVIASSLETGYADPIFPGLGVNPLVFRWLVRHAQALNAFAAKHAGSPESSEPLSILSAVQAPSIEHGYTNCDFVGSLGFQSWDRGRGTAEAAAFSKAAFLSRLKLSSGIAARLVRPLEAEDEEVAATLYGLPQRPASGTVLEATRVPLNLTVCCRAVLDPQHCASVLFSSSGRYVEIDLNLGPGGGAAPSAPCDLLPPPPPPVDASVEAEEASAGAPPSTSSVDNDDNVSSLVSSLAAAAL